MVDEKKKLVSTLANRGEDNRPHNQSTPVSLIPFTSSICTMYTAWLGEALPSRDEVERWPVLQSTLLFCEQTAASPPLLATPYY